MLEFHAIGTPAPQGSKSFKGMRTSAKTGRQVPVLAESSEQVRPWRAVVAWSAHDAIIKAGMRYPNKPAIAGAVHLHVVFSLPRPKSAKPGAWPVAKPDLDKLVRSTMDGLTEARAWEDDSRVVTLVTKKIFVGDTERGGMEVLGAFIRIKGAYE